MSNIFYRMIWWLSETLHIPLGRFAPYVFHQMIGGDKPANVVDIDDYRPHITVEMECSYCNKDWIAVAPEDVEKLQCPRCSNFTKLTEEQNE